MAKQEDYGGLVFQTSQECCPECGRHYETPDKCGVVWNARGFEHEGRRVSLSYREREVFKVLLARFNATVHRSFIYDRIWGDKEGFCDKVVDVYVCKIRRKLKRAGVPLGIETVWGTGFILRALDVGNVVQECPTKESGVYAH